MKFIESAEGLDTLLDELSRPDPENRDTLRRTTGRIRGDSTAGTVELLGTGNEHPFRYRFFSP